MPMRTPPGLVFFALALSLLGVAGQAQAGVRAFTLLEIHGPGGEKFSRALEAELGELYTLVGSDVYRQTAERMGMAGPSPVEVQAVCRRLRLDAVVAGAVVRDGNPRALLVVRDCSSGQVVARLKYDLSGITLPALRDRAASDLARAFEKVGRVAAPVAVETDDGPSDEVTTTAEVHAPAARTEWPVRGVVGGVGIALLGRTLHFDNPSAPYFGGGTVVGIRATGRVFPFALSAEWAAAHPHLARIAVGGSYEHVFTFGAVGASGTSSAGHASRWQADITGRVPLGKTGGVLSLEGSFQELSWGQATATLGVPDVSYDLLGGAVGWEHDLGTPRVTFDLRLGFYGMLSAGAIATETEYGRSAGWGLDASAGLTVRPTTWFWMRLSGRFTPMFLSFAGAGARLARSAVDQWTDGVLEVGFAL